MKILYLTNHFALSSHPGAARPWKVAQYLRKLGHDITVITNHRHYLNENIKVGNTDISNPFVVDGVEIIGVHTTSGRRKTIGKRILNYLSFAIGALLVGLKLDKNRIIISGTPPLLAPLTGILLGFYWNAYMVLEVRDLHPEKAIALGKLNSRFLILLWRGYELFLRNLYDHIVAVEPSTKKALLKKCKYRHKVTLITNGFDLEQLEEIALPRDLDDVFNKYREWTKVVYGGGMGFGNYLTPIIDAAYLVQREKIVFLLFGEGELKAKYKMAINKRGLENVLIFSAQSRKVIAQVFRQADILAYSAMKNKFFDGLLTNKIFEYHGAAKPIVFSGRGTMAKMIQTAGSGIVVVPEKHVDLAEAIKYLSKNQDAAEKMGLAGRSYILKYFQRDVVFLGWKKVIDLAENNAL